MKDNRDPQKVGDLLLGELAAAREGYDNVSASEAADRLIRYLPVADVVDPDPVTRYPTVGELVVETSYRRLPIERLAEVPGPPAAPRGPWVDGMVG